jgi:biotin transport system substrate-specific component
MEATLKKQTTAWPLFLATSLLGGALIALSAWIKIPFYPVPFTLHTFAVILIGLTQKPSQAFASVIAYLIAATAGLPVLNGGLANMYWIVGPTAGYLVAFPFAACLISALKTRIHPLLAIFAGQALIFASGFSWLAYLIGPSLAWTKGVFLFLASDALKAIAAFVSVKLCKSRSSFLRH